MTTVLLKLVTGEEVVGTRVETLRTSTTSITLKSPRSLIFGQRPDGTLGVQMIPFMVSDPDGEIPIDLDKLVVSPYDAPKPLDDAYIQSTSNIQIATSMPGVK